MKEEQEQEVIGQITLGDKVFDHISSRRHGAQIGDVLGKMKDGELAMYGRTDYTIAFGIKFPYFVAEYPPELVGKYVNFDAYGGTTVYLRRRSEDQQQS